MAIGSTVPSTTLTDSKESLKNVHGEAIQGVFGHKTGEDVPSSDHEVGTVASNGNALVFQVTPNALYEFTVIDDTTEATAQSGVGDAVFIRQAPTTALATIAAFGKATSTDFLDQRPLLRLPIREHILPGNNYFCIATVANAGKALRVFARRIL